MMLVDAISWENLVHFFFVTTSATLIMSSSFCRSSSMLQVRSQSRPGKRRVMQWEILSIWCTNQRVHENLLVRLQHYRKVLIIAGYDNGSLPHLSCGEVTGSASSCLLEEKVHYRFDWAAMTEVRSRSSRLSNAQIRPCTPPGSCNLRF